MQTSSTPHGGGRARLRGTVDVITLQTLARRDDIAELTAGYGRILRPYDGKATAEVHDYHDQHTGVLASSLAKRAPGYTSLGFPDPRKLPYTPSADTALPAQPRGSVA